MHNAKSNHNQRNLCFGICGRILYFMSSRFHSLHSKWADMAWWRWEIFLIYTPENFSICGILFLFPLNIIKERRSMNVARKVLLNQSQRRVMIHFTCLQYSLQRAHTKCSLHWVALVWDTVWTDAFISGHKSHYALLQNHYVRFKFSLKRRKSLFNWEFLFVMILKLYARNMNLFILCN